MSSKKGEVPYTDPVTGDVHWVEADRLIGQTDNSLKGTPKGAMVDGTKGKISKGLKKSHAENPRVQSASTKEQISESLVGRKVSDETRRKQSERAKERWAKKKAGGFVVSAATKKKLSRAATGRPKSAEHRGRISASLKARKARN